MSCRVFRASPGLDNALMTSRTSSHVCQPGSPYFFCESFTMALAFSSQSTAAASKFSSASKGFLFASSVKTSELNSVAKDSARPGSSPLTLSLKNLLKAMSNAMVRFSRISTYSRFVAATILANGLRLFVNLSCAVETLTLILTWSPASLYSAAGAIAANAANMSGDSAFFICFLFVFLRRDLHREIQVGKLPLKFLAGSCPRTCTGMAVANTARKFTLALSRKNFHRAHSESECGDDQVEGQLTR